MTDVIVFIEKVRKCSILFDRFVQIGSSLLRINKKDFPKSNTKKNDVDSKSEKYMCKIMIVRKGYFYSLSVLG